MFVSYIPDILLIIINNSHRRHIIKLMYNILSLYKLHQIWEQSADYFNFEVEVVIFGKYTVQYRKLIFDT